jgi:hypothetical protein
MEDGVAASVTLPCGKQTTADCADFTDGQSISLIRAIRAIRGMNFVPLVPKYNLETRNE